MVGHPEGAAERSVPRPGTAPERRAQDPRQAGRDGGGAVGPVQRQVLLLQRSIGNRSVTALLHPEPVQRQEATPGFQPAGNPLVGLKRGDGLVFGTFDRRTRVRALQERLNAKTGAGLDEDGMFGPRTSEALETFQAGNGLPTVEPVDPATADALMDRTAPSGGIAGVPAGSEATVRTRVAAAGQKLVESKLQFETAAAALEQLGSDLSNSSRPRGLIMRLHLRNAALQLREASTLITAAGAKMVVGGPTAPAFPVPGGNQLVGLKRGDGLDLGTEDRRPRVVQLQERLNQRMSAELVLDGMFGPKTTLAVNEFQRSIRVPESDIVDQVTADALETGQIGQAVAVPGAEELDLAEELMEAAGTGIENAGNEFSDPRDENDLLAGARVVLAGRSIRTAGRLLGQAGAAFRESSTRESTEIGGGALSESGSAIRRGAENLLSAAVPLPPDQHPGNPGAIASLTLSGNTLDAAGLLLVNAGVDIVVASLVMTPAA